MKAIAALGLALALPAAAAQDPVNAAQLLACADLADSGARLACFDRLAAAVRPPRPAPAPAPVAATPATPPATSAPAPAVARSTAPPPPSLGEEQIRKSQSERDAAQEPAVKARISASQRLSGGRYQITLDNGQVWRHEDGSQMEYLKAGEAVTISRAALGSYRLTIDSLNSGKWVRVSRVR
jgi:hypothetical protein